MSDAKPAEDDERADAAVSELPPVTSIRRYRYREGDHLVVRINERITDATGDYVRTIVSMTLGVPRDCILILSQGSDLKVVRNVPEAQVEPLKDPLRDPFFQPEGYAHWCDTCKIWRKSASHCGL